MGDSTYHPAKVEDADLEFRALGERTSEDAAQLAEWMRAGLVRVLRHHGRSLEGIDDVGHVGEQPVPGPRPRQAVCRDGLLEPTLER